MYNDKAVYNSPETMSETRQGEVFQFPETSNLQPATCNIQPETRRLYIESYGCQMNFSDSEIVASVMKKSGFITTTQLDEADVIFINTCAIRENAEQKIRYRLKEFNALKKNNPGMIIGVLGCMAERLKTKFLEEEKIIDLVAGPDAYRDLPNLIDTVDDGQKMVNVLLSREETYADISPVRLNSNGVSAFISIMRGCDNMCSFCVVPFTRGRERSRDDESICNEAKELFQQGYREVTLLGQNVDSYKPNFTKLLEKVACINPLLRVRFTTSHPKDITDEVLQVMKRYDNICKHIHLPVQSGNNRILELMNRTYDRDWYLERVHAIRTILGEECGITSDIITGFCTETEAEHRDTLSIMNEVRYHYAFTFKYSERPGTLAQRKYKDDIKTEIKQKRLSEIIELQRLHSFENNKKNIGKVYSVLVEGGSKRSDNFLFGRNTQNSVIVFPKENIKKGDYVNVRVERCTGATLIGKCF